MLWSVWKALPQDSPGLTASASLPHGTSQGAFPPQTRSSSSASYPFSLNYFLSSAFVTSQHAIRFTYPGCSLSPHWSVCPMKAEWIC